MDKKSSVPTAIAFVVVIVIICLCIFLVKRNVQNNQTKNKIQKANEIGKLSDMNVYIGNKKYTAKSEISDAAKYFLEQLPLNLEMKDVDSNEKYGYVYFKLKTEVESFKTVEAGDILLEGESGIIIAYKTYKTNKKYTKLGHIDNIGELPNGEVQATISKKE